MQEQFEDRHVKVLDVDSRGLNGELLKAGTSVLYNSFEKDVFREDTPENRRQFQKQGYAWTPGARNGAWYPPIEGAIQSRFDRAKLACKEFVGALDENMRGTRKKVLPDSHVSLVAHLLPWRHCVHRVDWADLTEEFVSRMLVCDHPSVEAACPEKWKKTLQEVNALRIYTLKDFLGAVVVDVIVAFFTPVTFCAFQEPSIDAPNMKHEEMIRELYAQWCVRKMHKAAFSFYSLGSAQKWQHRTRGSADGNSWLVVSYHDAANEWVSEVPPRKSSRIAFNDFVRRLKPITEQEKVFCVKNLMDTHVKELHEGNFSTDKAAKEANFHKREVLTAFKELEKSGDYQRYRVKDENKNVLALAPVNKAGITKRVALYYEDTYCKFKNFSFGLGGVALGFGIEKTISCFVAEGSWGGGFIVVLGGYVGGWIGKHFLGRELV